MAARGATPGSAGEAQRSAVVAEDGTEKLISGRVADNNGTPVADAEIRYAVIVYPFEGKIESGYSSYSNPDFFTRTGVDGTFRFELVEWMPFDSKEMLKRLNITITHPDYAIWWQEVLFQSTTDMGIQLEMPEMVSGKVMNEAGEPIQNAEVQIQSVARGDLIQGDPGNRLMPNALPQPVKTDANGEFVLLGLPRGAAISLDIKGPGYAKENRHNVPVSAKRLDFWLKREGRIKGRLTYADTGEPITHARVGCGWGQALVDRNGNYLLANLAPGTYSVYLANGPKGWTAIPKESVTISEGQTVSNVDLPLIPSGFIAGRVTNRDTNEPIARHPIRLNDAARPEGSHLMAHYALTDMTGAYRFDAAPGRVLVYTNLPVGYQDNGQIENSISNRFGDMSMSLKVRPSSLIFSTRGDEGGIEYVYHCWAAVRIEALDFLTDDQAILCQIKKCTLCSRTHFSRQCFLPPQEQREEQKDLIHRRLHLCETFPTQVGGRLRLVMPQRRRSRNGFRQNAQSRYLRYTRSHGLFGKRCYRTDWYL